MKRYICFVGKKLPPGLTDTDGANSGGEVSDEDEAAEGVEFHQGMELHPEDESKKKKKTVNIFFYSFKRPDENLNH